MSVSEEILIALVRIADALERANPPKRNPPKRKQRTRSLKTPVVMFSDVPPSQVRVWESSRPDECRCDAACRPWLNGMKQPGKWARCSNKKLGGDCMCRIHRTQANAAGVQTWEEFHKSESEETP